MDQSEAKLSFEEINEPSADAKSDNEIDEVSGQFHGKSASKFNDDEYKRWLNSLPRS